jgi:hypothetical protein
MAEYVNKLSAVCVDCGQEAYFTFKHTSHTTEINDIGGIEKYIPVCRPCFNSLDLKQKQKLSTANQPDCLSAKKSTTTHSSLESSPISTN